MNILNKCDGCIFGDKCRADGGCEDYSPIDIDEEINALIETERVIFHELWEEIEHD